MLKKQQLKIGVRLLISIGVLTIFSIVANIVLLQQNKNTTLDRVHFEEEIHNKFVLLEQEQFSLARQIDSVATAANTSLDDIATLRVETVEQLEESQSLNQSALDNAQETLRDELEESIKQSNDRVVSIVDEWDNILGLVTCGGSRGSGVLFNLDNVTSLVTNRHVIAGDDNILTAECSVTFPSGQTEDFDFTPVDVIFDLEDLDFAVVALPLQNTVAQIEAKNRNAWCTAQPSVGDGIIVLGYPAIGAKESLTVTEGIISGYDDKYFISSAKVDKGNSGGATIWIENDCYLGIPTKVYAGVAETLARILNIQEIEF